MPTNMHKTLVRLIAMLVPLQECYSVLREGAAVEAYMSAPQLCHTSYDKAGNKSVIVVKCKRSQCLWSFCKGLLGIAVRDILALHCGRVSRYDVKVDRVKPDVQVCFEGLLVCITGPCHGAQALLQPCALIFVNVLGLKFCW